MTTTASRRARLLAPALLTAALTLSACGGGSSSSTAGEAADAAPTTVAATDVDQNATLQVRAVLEPTDVDVFHTAGVALDQVLLDNVYQGLVRADTNRKDAIVPALAKSWTTSSDGRTWTFALAGGATFHDGSALTSKDVVDSLDAARDPKGGNFQAAALSSISSVSAPDDATVVIELKHRDTNLLWSLTQRAGIVYASGTDFDALKTKENGSGPYTLGQVKKGSSITLDRWDANPGTKPAVKAVTFSYIPDDNAANAAQLSGQTQVETAVKATLTSSFRGNQDIAVRTGETTDKYTLAFNQDAKPLDDLRVRQALKRAVNNAGLLKALGGAGEDTGGPASRQDPWFEDLTSVDAYDPASAKQLLAAAGHATGLKLTLQIPNIYPTTIGDALVSDFKAVGVQLTVKQVEFPTWLSKVYTDHDYDLSVVDHADPRDLGNYVTKGYYFGSRDEAVAGTYQDGIRAADDNARDTAWKSVSKSLATEAVAEYLLLAKTITAVDKRVSGVPVNETSNRFYLGDVKVAKG